MQLYDSTLGFREGLSALSCAPIPGSVRCGWRLKGVQKSIANPVV